MKRIYIYILNYIIRVAKKKYNALLSECYGTLYAPASDRILSSQLICNIFRITQKQLNDWVKSGRITPKTSGELGEHRFTYFCPAEILEAIMAKEYGPTKVDSEILFHLDMVELSQIWRGEKEK